MSEMQLVNLNSNIFNLINSHNTPLLDILFYFITYLGSGWILIPVVFILYKTQKEKILPVMASFLVSGITVQLIKFFWKIPRPAAVFENSHIVGETLRIASFPSGHTATAFALFYVLTRGMSRQLNAFFLVLAFAVAYSRIYVGAHFPADIIGGGIIGLMSGYISIKYNDFFKKYKKELLIVFLIPVVIFFYKLGELPFFIVDEARNVEAAREMLESADFLVPTYNYELRTDKPPLHYWVFIGLYKIFGVSEFASRIGSAVVGVVMAFLICIFSIKKLNRQIALTSTLIFTTALYSFLLFRMAVPDPYFVLFCTISLLSFYQGLTLNSYKYFLIFYSAMGLAVLTKGPVGFILPFSIAICFTFFNETLIKSPVNIRSFLKFIMTGMKSLKLFCSRLHIIGYLIVFAIAAPWYIIVSIKTGGEFASGFFLHHNVTRFLRPLEGPEGPFFITLLFLIIGFFPWSFFIIQTAVSSFKERKDPLVLFLCIWVIIHIVFYSFSATKLPHYLVPAYPALAVLTARYIEGIPYKRLSSSLIGIVGLIISTALIIAGSKYAKDLMPLIVLIGAPFLIGGILAVFVNKYTVQITAGSALIFFLMLSGWIAPLSHSLFMPGKIAGAIAEEVKKSDNKIDKVYSYKYYDPAFEFYIRKKIIKIGEPSSLPDGALLISTEDKLSALNIKYQPLFRHKDILRKNKEVVVVRIEKRSGGGQ